MKASEHSVDVLVQGSCGLYDLLDSWMRASDHDHQTLGSAKGQGNLVHLLSAGNVRNVRNDEHAWCDFRRPLDLFEMSCRPWATARPGLLLHSVKVVHVYRQGRIVLINGGHDARKHGSAKSRDLVWRVNRNVRIYAQHITEPTGVVTVSMG